MRVVVLGASGMLGSMVLDYFSRHPALKVVATARESGGLDTLRSRLPSVDWRSLDAETCSDLELRDLLGNAAWAVNAIGVIKPYIRDDNRVEVERAVVVNALFPHRLARAAEETGCCVLQIATDCVYSGRKGRYVETDAHDPLDVYGKTKSVGEVHSPNVYHLRCSIIGPEPKGHVSLLDWFSTQPPAARINGFTNHQWNGVTTLHFTKLCHGVISEGLRLGHIQHVVPSDSVSKAALLGYFARAYKREDVTITLVEANTVVDRTLATADEAGNRKLWASAGYPKPPSVSEMVDELARFDYRFKGV